jgi:hypothetical protein
MLFLNIKGRVNLYPIEKYEQFSEQRYRQQFGKPFNFMTFNKELISLGSGRFVIAFDLSYINKSGKKPDRKEGHVNMTEKSTGLISK